jgi:hypothetical protein
VVARYSPVWQFSVRVHCRWRHTATDDDGGERVTEGTVRGDYGEREPGNQHLPAGLLAALPFPFEHAVAFDRRYLAGAMVEQHDGNIFRAWDAAHARRQALVDHLVDREAGAFKRPQERWPSMSQEKGWLILAPFYTANVEINGTRHHIVVDGHGGGVASDVPEAFPIGALLVAVTLVAMLIAVGWWGVTWLVGP